MSQDIIQGNTVSARPALLVVAYFDAVFVNWSRFEWEKTEQLYSFLFKKFPYQFNAAEIHYFSNSDQVCSSTYTYATHFGVIKLLWSTFHTQVYIPLVPQGFHELSLNCSLLWYPLCYKNLSAMYILQKRFDPIVLRHNEVWCIRGDVKLFTLVQVIALLCLDALKILWIQNCFCRFSSQTRGACYCQ